MYLCILPFLLLDVCFILTKWYVNAYTSQTCARCGHGFILTKWYVNMANEFMTISLKYCFILTKWYVNY